MTGVKSEKPSWIARLLDFERDGDVFVDFTGTDPQARGPVNSVFGTTVSTTSPAFVAGYAKCKSDLKFLAAGGAPAA